MNHSIERCRVCENYLRGIDNCKFCHFEWAIDYPPTDDKVFDILDLDCEIEWEHYQILDRLHYKNIDCLFADIFPSDMVFLIGCTASADAVAMALGVDKRCIYCDYEHSLIIVNLVEEMALRMDLDIQEMYKDDCETI